MVDPSVFEPPCITTVPPNEGKSLRSKAVLLLLPVLVVVVVPLVPPGAIVAAPDVDDTSVPMTAFPKPFPTELDVLTNPPAPPSKRSDMPLEGFCWLLLLVPPNMPCQMKTATFSY